MDLFGLICLLPTLGAGGLYGYLILKPVLQKAGQPRGESRFLLSDFFWLAALLQLPLTFIAAIHRRATHHRADDFWIFFLLDGLLLGVVIFVWWRGATRLTALGVRHVGRRGVFLVLLLPIAVLGSLIAVPVAMAAVLTFANGEQAGDTAFAIGGGGSFLLVIVGLASHNLTRWVVSDESPDDTPASDVRPDDPSVQRQGAPVTGGPSETQ